MHFLFCLPSNVDLLYFISIWISVFLFLLLSVDKSFGLFYILAFRAYLFSYFFVLVPFELTDDILGCREIVGLEIVPKILWLFCIFFLQLDAGFFISVHLFLFLWIFPLDFLILFINCFFALALFDLFFFYPFVFHSNPLFLSLYLSLYLSLPLFLSLYLFLFLHLNLHKFFSVLFLFLYLYLFLLFSLTFSLFLHFPLLLVMLLIVTTIVFFHIWSRRLRRFDNILLSFGLFNFVYAQIYGPNLVLLLFLIGLLILLY